MTFHSEKVKFVADDLQGPREKYLLEFELYYSGSLRAVSLQACRDFGWEEDFDDECFYESDDFSCEVDLEKLPISQKLRDDIEMSEIAYSGSWPSNGSRDVMLKMAKHFADRLQFELGPDYRILINESSE